MNLRKIFEGLLMVVIGLWILFPLYWLFNMSFKSFGELRVWPPTLIPQQFTLENYIKGIFEYGAAKYLLNTIIISVTSAVLALIISLPMAYVASRYEFKGKWDIMFTILTFRFLPPAAIVIPLYMFGRMLGLLDTYLLLICIYSAINIPLATWVLMSYIDEVPIEVEESYMLDGYTKLESFFRVVLPLCKSGIIAIAMIIIALSYGEYLLAAMLTSTEAKTFPVFLGERWESPRGMEYGLLASSAVVALIPLLIIYLIARKHLVRGLTFGAVR